MEHAFDKEYIEHDYWAIVCKCGQRFLSKFYGGATVGFVQHIKKSMENTQMGDEQVEKTETTTTQSTETQTHPEGNDDPAAPHVVEPERVETTTTETVESTSSDD